MTFATKGEAPRWLAMMEADLVCGLWNYSKAAGKLLDGEDRRRLAQRSGLFARSTILYDGLLRIHILPKLGSVRLRLIIPGIVRVVASRSDRRQGRAEHRRERLIDHHIQKRTAARCRAQS